MTSSGSSGWGNSVVWTSTDGGEKLHLAHLATMTRTGAVTGGEQIATLGSTGKSTAPHLHLSRAVRGVAAPAVLSGVTLQPTLNPSNYGRIPCNGKTYRSVGQEISQLRARVKGDFNGDGTADVAILRKRADGGADVWALRGSKTGSTPLTGVQLLKSLPRSNGWLWTASKPIAGDFNADGTADLAILHKRGDGGIHVWILWGSPTGSTPLNTAQLVKRLIPTSGGWHWNYSTPA